MISRLLIENFRTHIKSEFNFVPGINALVGAPDSGKTNVIRAISWALTNRPLGFRFHSDISPDDDTIVRIEYQEGTWIQLKKNKKLTKYSTCFDDKLEAMGSEVPDVISSISNMNELNIQRQLDQPFLICSSPSEVAKIFNRITKLERIDKSVSLLTTDINSANKNIKIVSEQAQKLIDQINTLKNVDEMCRDNDRLQWLDKDFRLSTEHIQDLEDAISNAKTAEAELIKYKLLKEMNNDMDEIEDSSKRLECLQKKIIELSSLIDYLNHYDEEIKISFNMINKSLSDYEILQNLYESYKQILDEIESLDESIITLKLADNQIEIEQNKLQSKVGEYRKFLKTVTVCPFCVKCQTPLEEHDFNLFLKEFDV